MGLGGQIAAAEPPVLLEVPQKLPAHALPQALVAGGSQRIAGTSDPFWHPAPSGYSVIAGPKAIELNKVGEPYNHRRVDVQPSQPYAYGWFGGIDRSQWHRQFGSSRRHTQWSLR